jgi:iron complex outermembrane receptor protein
MLGLRNSDVNFSVQDHFMTPTNGNDGGSVTYTAGTPVAGLTFKLRPWVHLYVSWGRGFETPLGSELAYRPDGEAGPNFDLRPARSANSELGAKFQLLPSFNAEATIFNTNTHDEIVVDTNLGGRSTYQNSGRTTRRGAEAGLDWRFAAPWHLQLAYTYVEATYTDAYFTCTTAPCAVPDALVPAGNRLPGVPKNNVFGTVRFGDELGPFAAAEAQYVSTVAANDVNSVFAPGYAVFGVSGGYAARWPSGDWSLFVRINNLLNRHYVGSLIVDDSNKGYFETAAPFNVLVGGALSWR